LLYRNTFDNDLSSAKYCGQAPLINNGYVKSSTGVQFGDTVTYKCYGGYRALKDTITCRETGQWEDTPSCTGKLQFCNMYHNYKMLLAFFKHFKPCDNYELESKPFNSTIKYSYGNV